jgi:N-methylhydantoinase A
LKPLWIGIDTGGTFTDLVAVDLAHGRYAYHKLPTTPDDASRGILQGVSELLAGAGLAADNVGYLCHGTTLATNAVLQGKWARTAVLTTAGFRDVLELGRQRRPHFFNLDIQKPMPPAPRECRLELRERVAPDGTVVEPLVDDEVRAAIETLRGRQVTAVAICFLHSYANPAHEARVRDLLCEIWPDAYVCASSDLLPEFREFERFATTTVNASLMPIVDHYLERFEKGVAELGIPEEARVMQSNGGAVSPAAVRRAPVNTFFSGPAGGVIGAAGVYAEAGINDLITFDMGGTSTDVCLVRDGVPARKNLREMGGFPVRTPTLDLHTIGAGGGSIAWVDPGGLLKVGPMSAGAVPGPAAYRRGGKLPTVTDANVVLGRLNQKSLLSGRMAIDPQLARNAIETELCGKLGIDVTRAAAGILEIVNVNMMGAVRVISVEQGEDPRRFALVAFGGAGPLHAVDVARNMGIPCVLVPPRPGLLSAIGLIHADIRGDFSLTRLVAAEAPNLSMLNEGRRELWERSRRWLAGEAVRDDPGIAQWHADMRYLGQNFELGIPMHESELDGTHLSGLVATFHGEHKAAYGYDLPEQPVEVVNLRLSVTVQRRSPATERPPASARPVAEAVIEHRQVWFPETGFVTAPIYDREALPAGATFAGPAVIEQMDATTVVPPNGNVAVDDLGNLRIDVPSVVAETRRGL